jgi:hypothetical protein
VPVARLALVEETITTPARAGGAEDDTPVYRVAEPDGRSDEVANQIARDKVDRWVAEAEADLKAPEFDHRAWLLEKDWAECLLYPLRAGRLMVMLGVMWATLLAIALALSIPPHGLTWPDPVLRLPWFLALTLLLGYTFALLRATLAAAMEGRAGHVFRPDNVPLRTLRGCAEAVLSFLAGPVVLLAVAFFFWLESGELEFVDRLILWELCLAAVGYWALALLAMWEGGRFRDANPAAVWSLIRRAGRRVPLAAALGALAVVAHGRAALGALEELHRAPVGGWFTLTLCWAGLLSCLLFLLRWLGVSRFRAWRRGRKRRAGHEEPPEPPAVGAERTDQYRAAALSPGG